MSGIVIHRSRHAQNYVVIGNELARDSRLSFRARGLLVMLLSLPPEWHVTTDILAEDNPESRTALRSAMAELRAAGYVEVHKQQGERGRWMTRLEVFDTSATGRALPASGPTSENSASPQVAPNASRPAAGGAAPYKKYGGEVPKDGTAAGAPFGAPRAAGAEVQPGASLPHVTRARRK